MRFRVKIEGRTPMLQHDRATGLNTEDPRKIELADLTSRRSGSKADQLRIRELECECSFWTDEEGKPTVPDSAIRTCIEAAARKVKDGPRVREGLVVEKTESFDYDRGRYGSTMEELRKNCQFTVPVVIGGRAILRTRARFDCPWSVTFLLDCDDELIDRNHLIQWLDIAGRRIGLGDWRPAKSGKFGRFNLAQIEEF